MNIFVFHILIVLYFLNCINRKILSNDKILIKLFQNETLLAIRKQRIKTDKDLPPFYPNGWIALLMSTELAVNEVKSVITCGKELIAFRGKSGAVHVLEAFCSDIRNTGHVISIDGEECVNCAVHDLTFRAKDGLGINKNSNIEKAFNYCSLWNVMEQNNLIYVWHHLNGLAPNRGVTKLDNKYKYVGDYSEYSNGFLQDVYENGADLQHFKVVHRPLIYSDNLFIQNLISKIIHIEYERESGAPEEKYKHDISMKVKICLFSWVIVKGVSLRGSIDCQTSFTSIQQVLGTDYVIVVIAHSLSKDKFRLRKIWYSEDFLISKLVACVLHKFTKNFTKDDLVIWRNKIFKKQPMYSKHNNDIVNFRKWVENIQSDK